MKEKKPGIRPKKGATVIIVECGKPREEVVTKAGTKWFYVGEQWRARQFAMGCDEGAHQTDWLSESSYVYSTREAYDLAMERRDLLRLLHNAVLAPPKCSVENIRQAIALLKEVEK